MELGKAEGRGETCEGLQTAEGGTHPASWQHLGRGVSRPSPNPTQLAWALTQGQGLRCRGAFEAGVGARQDSTAGSLAWRPGAHSHACGAIVPASPAHAAQAIREGQSISFAQSAERCGPRELQTGVGREQPSFGQPFRLENHSLDPRRHGGVGRCVALATNRPRCWDHTVPLSSSSPRLLSELGVVPDPALILFWCSPTTSELPISAGGPRAAAVPRDPVRGRLWSGGEPRPGPAGDL